MWTRIDFKNNGKIAFKRNYWTCVLACVIAGLLGGAISGGGSSINFGSNSSSSDTVMMGDGSASMINITPQFLGIAATTISIVLVIGIIFTLLVSNVVRVGSCRFFMENREHKTDIGEIFYGFKEGRYSNMITVMGVYTLKIFLWSLLFIIPGIVKSYEYWTVSWILAENPSMDHRRAHELSRLMMNGHKGEAFIMGLSFIGWMLLGSLTCGILNVFYVNPYISATYAEFYTARKSEAIAKGYVMAGELPGVSGKSEWEM